MVMVDDTDLPPPPPLMVMVDDATDLRRNMAEQRAQIQRRFAAVRDRASAFNAALLSARSIADQTVSRRARLHELKLQLRKHEADLAQALTFQASKRSTYKLISESNSNTTATNEQLRSLVVEHKAKRDDYTNIISNQLKAIESLEADNAARGDKNLDEVIMWYNKFLGFRVVGGEGVKFVFNKIDLQSPDKEYFFSIKLTKEKYTLLQCVPLVEGSKELLNDLNCDNDLFKFVRIMRERFQAATIRGVLPSGSFCSDTLSITSSSLSALSLDSRSESMANQRHTRSEIENQEIPTKKGL
ncbi:hypothetical protein QOZ80_1AG0048250 [Eleusine coracana subsp. coracana]|nr:hypothetical protein QOZ80_1AG0048250 [Eleusine coracana subsp. coracana]